MPKSQDEGREKAIEKKLDVIIKLIEDLFILEATKAHMGRDDIRSILHVHTTRISKISGGLKGMS